jgi:2-polyprenyl-3-methyl-5-hydroxy-6-metoxy-1,4-benzoquinol methylase
MNAKPTVRDLLSLQEIGELRSCPDISRVVQCLLAVWPEHGQYCKARFDGNDAAFLERTELVAGLILKIVGSDLKTYCIDYRWMCEGLLKEEIYFRRHGKYRLSTFEEAFTEIYGVKEYMSKYVRGLLISQLIWSPHARALDYFRTAFLERIPEQSSYLEVGPGHGLFLFFGAQCPNLDRLEGWDVSASSIAETNSTLKSLGVTRDITIIAQDVLRAPSRFDQFDAAVISEVLEHLEQPDLALRTLRTALKPGGRIFINAPLNSPAPDHIYLWRTPEEFRRFVIDQGFEIESCELFPVTGTSLALALRQKLSVSCVVVGVKPHLRN